MLESLTLFVRTVTYSFIGLSFFVRCSAKLPPTDGGMKSCQLRAISCQVTQKLKRATTLE